MEINKTLDGSKLTVALSGRLDTTTAPVFEKELKESLDSVDDLTLDFSGLEYNFVAAVGVIFDFWMVFPDCECVMYARQGRHRFKATAPSVLMVCVCERAEVNHRHVAGCVRGDIRPVYAQ